MREGGKIAGKVTETKGNALANIQVTALSESGHLSGFATTNAGGEYTISGLPSGSYRIEFSGNFLYLTGYYNGKSSLAEADPVSVEVGKAHEAINATLNERGKIAGKVSDSKGNPLANIQVTVFDPGGSAGPGIPIRLGSATTNASGEYTISGLPTGSHEVEFSGSPYLNQYYSGKSSPAEGDSVAVEPNRIHEGIDATMHEGGKITGYVTDRKGNPLTNILVTVLQAGGGSTEAGFTFTNSGEYTISGLPTGSYKVEFTGSPYQAQYYNGKSSLGEADPVSVEVEKTHEGIDSIMHQGGKIAGKVTDSKGNALANIQVTVLSQKGARIGSASAMTNSSGEYTLSGLPTGSYKVEFSGSPYQTQYYSGKASLGEADSVSVELEQTQKGIDATMQEVGKIAGKVTDSNGNPLANIQVTALEGAAPSVATNSSGEYTISGLHTGSYKVEFSSNPLYLAQYYDDKFSLSEAEAVTVEAGRTHAGISATMVSSQSAAPVNLKAPGLTGTPAIGDTLTPGASNGANTNAGGGQGSSSASPVGTRASARVESSSIKGGSEVALRGAMMLRAGVVFIQLHCSSHAGCPSLRFDLTIGERVRNGRVTGIAWSHQKTTNRVVIVGETTTSLAAGQSQTLRVPLNPLGRALESRYKKLATALQVTLETAPRRTGR
jgi:protocatechuate 3,4-dioxygenase beta subunit